jgi:flavin-dependent dehydrogenase
MKKEIHAQNIEQSSLSLADNSRVAVIGGGPAGSFFSYFLLVLAERVGLEIYLDIFESRNFVQAGPPGCNMCGGIISESLVQTLATEGIELPPTVIQRGIDSYLLHMDVGSVKIETPHREKRIGAVHRGVGPRGLKEKQWEGFDGFLLGLAEKKGARRVSGRVEEIRWEGGRPVVKIRGGRPERYDFLAAAVGVNSPALKLFEGLEVGYISPGTTKTYICEYALGGTTLENYLGSSMHTFLLNIPRLEFAALIPKGEYATVCMLGKKIDKQLVREFMETIEVRRCFPHEWDNEQDACRCMPKINIKGSKHPFGDRLVFIGDCGISRLYKDGIGAAYKTAKAAATTAVFQGISGEDFKARFWPACRKLERDNRIGKMVFSSVGLIQHFRFARRAILRTVSAEQKREKGPRHLSTALWDMFTGSAPYREVLIRMIHPFFLGRFLWNLLVEIWPFRPKNPAVEKL